jgi:hypothetical protein
MKSCLQPMAAGARWIGQDGQKRDEFTRISAKFAMFSVQFVRKIAQVYSCTCVT